MLRDFYCVKAIHVREGVEEGDIIFSCPAEEHMNPGMASFNKVTLDVEEGTYENAVNISEVQ